MVSTYRNSNNPEKVWETITCSLKYKRKGGAQDCGLTFYKVSVDTVRENVGKEIDNYLRNYKDNQKQNIIKTNALRAEIKQHERAINNLLQQAEISPDKAIAQKIEEHRHEIDVIQDKISQQFITVTDQLSLRLLHTPLGITDADTLENHV